MSLGMKLFISPILTPIELVGKFTKPFALAIRLFANMTAGHVVVPVVERPAHPFRPPGGDGDGHGDLRGEGSG